MFCDNCGKELKVNANFCPVCGQKVTPASELDAEMKRLESQQNNVRQEPKPVKKKKRYWIIAVVCFLVIAFVAGVAVYYNMPANRLARQMDLGEKYLQELDYEQAVAAFTKALEIDPENEDIIESLADAYIGLKDYDKAMDVLRDGYKKTNSRSLKSMEADICLDYVEDLVKKGKLDEAIDVLKKRYKETDDDRLKKELDKLEEQKRIEEEERARAAEEAAKQQALDDCKARHDELVTQLGEGYQEGKMLPDFVFYDENGSPVHINDFIGKTVYINFFTTWCPYCYYEIPDMIRVDGEYDDEEAIIIMIDLRETVQEAKSYASTYGITMPIYYLSDWKAGNLDIEGVPLSIIIDKYGRIQGFHEGMSDYNWMSPTMSKAVSCE